jgi:hypothetical protein
MFSCHGFLVCFYFKKASFIIFSYLIYIWSIAIDPISLIHHSCHRSLVTLFTNIVYHSLLPKVVCCWWKLRTPQRTYSRSLYSTFQRKRSNILSFHFHTFEFFKCILKRWDFSIDVNEVITCKLFIGSVYVFFREYWLIKTFSLWLWVEFEKMSIKISCNWTINLTNRNF